MTMPDKRMLHAVSDTHAAKGCIFGPFFVTKAEVTTDVSVNRILIFGIKIRGVEIGISINRRSSRNDQ